MFKFICFALFVVCASAQISYVTLSNGVAVAAAFATEADDIYYYPTYYAVWVPWNASSVNITVVNTYPTTDDNCEYLQAEVRTVGFACSEDNDDANCYDVGDYDDDIYSDEPFYGLYGPGTDTDYEGLRWSVNAFWFVTVQREDSIDNAYACSYTIQATVTECAGTGLAVDPEDDGTFTCITATNVTVPGTYPLTSLADSYYYYYTNVPDFTGYVTMVVNSSDSDVYLYGNNYGPASDYEDRCEYDFNDGGVGFYITNLTCYTPRAGSFFFYPFIF